MEYREDPEKKKEENQDVGEEEFSFIQETIKDENGGYRKVRAAVLRCAGLGLLFGLAASLGFCALKPWAEEQFSGSPEKITIPEEEEEETAQNEEEEPQEPSPVLTVDDYREMNRALVDVADTLNRSMVEISVQVPQLEDTDNGAELLVAGRSISVPEEGALQARLADGKSYNITVKRQDTNLGIAVYAIAKNALPDTAWGQIQTAALGSSGGMSKGEVVIAAGSPFGYYGGLGFGIISSNRESVDRADGDYSLLCTDIGGSSAGTGVLANTEGEIVGLIDQERFFEGGEAGPVTAYGISDLKDALEFLSNNQAVPYIGVYGVTVTEELTSGQGIPSGVYVREVAADSPAMAAGIQSGDVITQVDGSKVTTLSGYSSALMQLAEGDEIRIRGQRQGTGGYVDITFRVTVGSKG